MTQAVVWWKRPTTWMLLVAASSVLLVAITLLQYRAVQQHTAPFLTNNPYKLSPTHIGLVLGTTKTLRNGQTNLYFRYRMLAAAQLFLSRRVKFLLVSGNGVGQNTETVDMKEALIKLGIPAKRILQDPKGLRTLDSVVRCHTVFHQKKFIVISQPFHNERAIYLGRHHKLTVHGFNAKDVREDQMSILSEKIREHLARVKAWLDLFVLNTKPKYGG